jgi:hypothetical protein
MGKLFIRIGGLVAAASVAVTLAGASPAFASTTAETTASAAAKTVTGPEAITGAAYGKAAVANVTPLPLTLVGLVPTTDLGFQLGNGNSNTHTLTTPAGKLTVTGTGKEAGTQAFNAQTCHITYTERQTFKFVPGQSSGKFAGASGTGAYQIWFSAYVPRYTSGKHKGQCDTASNVQPLAKGAVAKFLAAGVLTVG